MMREIELKNGGQLEERAQTSAQCMRVCMRVCVCNPSQSGPCQMWGIMKNHIKVITRRLLREPQKSNTAASPVVSAWPRCARRRRTEAFLLPFLPLSFTRWAKQARADAAAPVYPTGWAGTNMCRRGSRVCKFSSPHKHLSSWFHSVGRLCLKCEASDKQKHTPVTRYDRW